MHIRTAVVMNITQLLRKDQVALRNKALRKNECISGHQENVLMRLQVGFELPKSRTVFPQRNPCLTLTCVSIFNLI